MANRSQSLSNEPDPSPSRAVRRFALLERSTRGSACPVQVVDLDASIEAIGRPALVVVPIDEPPPALDSLLDDWTREDATDEDVAARLRTLRGRVANARRPVLAADGELHFLGSRRSVPPGVEDAVRLLVNRWGWTTSTSRLAAVCGVPVVQVPLLALRARRAVAPLGLTVWRAGPQGYVLIERSAIDGSSASSIA